MKFSAPDIPRANHPPKRQTQRRQTPIEDSAACLVSETILGDAPGVSTELNYYRIGSDASKPKIYLQAALHADEQPGILILHHLLEFLIKAEKDGQLNARFVLFPVVNPLGLQDIRFNRHQGRYDATSGLNHNRQWPDLCQAVQSRLQHKLVDNQLENLHLVRHTIAQWLAEQEPVSALEQQRLISMREAFDADVVLDLHCDEDALNHIFISPVLMPEYQDLADWMGSAATLTAEDSGGRSFDEVWSLLWIGLQAAFPDKPLPSPPLSATLEYRGNFDTFDHLNLQDAENLMGFFRSRNWITGIATQSPAAAAAARPLNATELLKASHAGLVVYQRAIGDQVRCGDLIAEIVTLEGANAFRARTPLHAGTDGLLFSRRINKYVWPGCTIAKIAGTEVLESRGEYLLSD